LGNDVAIPQVLADNIFPVLTCIGGRGWRLWHGARHAQQAMDARSAANLINALRGPNRH
jgi:hypothetical protein